MTDVATIGTVLASIKTATEIAKLIKDSDKSLEQAEYKLKLAELVSALADAKIEIVSILEIITDKDKEIKDLKKQLELKESVIWDAPSYFTEKSGKRDGPFCQQCYDTHHKLIRLQDNKNGVWTCNACKATVVDDTYYTDERY